MAQHLADVDQRGALAQQLTGERVPQTVRRDVLDARSTARVANDRSHPGRPDRPRRRMLAQKHQLTLVMAAEHQVCNERLPDIVGERQSGALMTLPVDLDLSGSPMQILDRESGGLDRAQPQPRQEHQDREVANAHPTRAITRLKHPLNRRACRELGDARLAPAPDRRHRHLEKSENP